MEYRDTLRQLLIYCGADSQRILERDFDGDLDSFIEYISRFDDVLKASGAPPILVMTKTTLLAKHLIVVREKLCEKFPKLEKALWVIFTPEDPFFQKNAGVMGRFITSPERAPIWIHESPRADGGKTQNHYLVLAHQMPPKMAREGAGYYNDLVFPKLRRASSTFRIEHVEELMEKQPASRP